MTFSPEQHLIVGMQTDAFYSGCMRTMLVQSSKYTSRETPKYCDKNGANRYEIHRLLWQDTWYVIFRMKQHEY